MKKLLSCTLASIAILVVAGTSAALATVREQRINIAVTIKGFEPATLRVKAGQPVRLVVTRKTERTCATEIVLRDYLIHKPLPLKKPVEVLFTPTKAGTIRYACAMDMIAGKLIVE